MVPLFKLDPLKLFPKVTDHFDPEKMNSDLWSVENIRDFEKHVYPCLLPNQEAWWRKVFKKENLDDLFEIDPEADIKVCFLFKCH